MQDTNLDQIFLGLDAPWEVVGVCLKSAEETVEVEVSNAERLLPCPVCGKSSPRYDTRTRRCLSWTAVDGIKKRAVRRGIKRRAFETGRTLPEHMGIDETSFQKHHEYVTVVCDQDSGYVVHVADGRKAEVGEEYLKPFEESERASVKTMAMDTWQGHLADRTPDSRCFSEKVHSPWVP